MVFIFACMHVLTRLLKNESPDPMTVYRDFSFLGRPPPAFILLAERILTISANSASCERLFSIFGVTLTKLRNRLGDNTLALIAELRMHIRDNHLQNETNRRLKRRFAKCPETSESVPLSGTAPEVQPPLYPTIENNEEALETNALEVLEVGNEFREIANHHSRMVDEDNLDNEPVSAPETIGRPVSIQELFDFSSTHWVGMYAKSAWRSFDEELELYELLDFDAEGEEDINIDVDESTADVLLG